MGERRGRSSVSERKTPEGMESYLVNLAMIKAESMLKKENPPAQIVTHFLKLGTEKARYEREKLKADTQLSISKANRIEVQNKYEEIASAALEAFKKYAGISEYVDEEDDNDEY